MKTSLSFFFMWLSIYASGQPVESVLSRVIGGSRDEMAMDAVRTADGGLVIAGVSHSSSSGDVTEAGRGEGDAWIVRLSASGEVLWSRLIGGSLLDVATGVEVMPAGEIVVSGYSHSSDGHFTFHLGGANEADAFMAKLTPAGELLSVHHVGITGEDRATDIICAGGNRIFMCGYRSPTVVNPGEEEDANVWVCKLDISGNMLWSHELEGPDDDYGRSVALVGDGGFVVSGVSGSFSVTPGDREAAVWKISSSGELEWSLGLGSESGMDNARVSEVHTDEQGDVYVGFTTTGMESDGVNCTPHGSFMIARVSYDGELQEVRCHGGSAEDRISSVEGMPNGRVAYLGTTRSSDGDVPPAAGIASTLSNCWLGIAEQDGSLATAVTLGGSATDEAVSVLYTTPHDLFLVLNTHSVDGIGSGNHHEGQGDYITSDVAIIRVHVDLSVGVEEQHAASSGIGLFPNPADDRVAIGITDPETLDEGGLVCISDASGRIVWSETISRSVMQADLGRLEGGLYFVHVLRPGGASEHPPQRLVLR